MQTSLFGQAQTGTKPDPVRAPPVSVESEDEVHAPAKQKRSPEERTFGDRAWLWVPGPALLVHWDVRHGYRLPDGTPWKAPRRLEPPWWKPVTSAPARQAYAAIKATVDRSCRYFFRAEGMSIQFGGGDLEDAGDGAVFGHWSCHLHGGGWAYVEGRRVVVLDDLSVETVDTQVGDGARLLRFTDGGEAQYAWAEARSLKETIEQAGSWADIADELQFLQASPSLSGFQAQATAAWEDLRSIAPSFTESGNDDGAWRAYARDGVVYLRHKATGKEVPTGAPTGQLHHNVHAFVRSLLHEAAKKPSLGSHIHVRHSGAGPVHAFLDRLDAALKWCKAPSADSWLLIGLRLGPDYGYHSDGWEQAFDLIKDIEELNPDPASPMGTCLARTRQLVQGASWNLPAILAVRDERVLRAAAALKPKTKRPARGKTQDAPGDDSEE